MSWGVAAWMWDRVLLDSDAADMLLSAGHALSALDERLTWIVPREQRPGDFESLPATRENVLRFGINGSERPYGRGSARWALLLTTRAADVPNASLTFRYFDRPAPSDTVALIFNIEAGFPELVDAGFLREAMRALVRVTRPESVWVSSPKDRTSEPDERVPRVGPLTYLRGAAIGELRTAHAEVFEDGVLLETRTPLIRPEAPEETTVALDELSEELRSRGLLVTVPRPNA